MSMWEVTSRAHRSYAVVITYYDHSCLSRYLLMIATNFQCRSRYVIQMLDASCAGASRSLEPRIPEM